MAIPPRPVEDGVSLPYYDEVGKETKQDMILQFCCKSRSKAEIQKHVGIKSERYVRQKLLISMLYNGRLDRTIPEIPSSPKQKYISTKTESERYINSVIDIYFINNMESFCL